MAMTMDDYVAGYIRLRDKVAELKKKHEEELALYTDGMAQLEAMFLEHLNAHNMDSFATPHGTPYRSRAVSVSVADWPAFYAWAQANQQEEMLTHGANKKIVDEYLLSSGYLPPGLNHSAIYKVNVRRK